MCATAKAAQRAWQEIELNFVDPAGGLHTECERDFKPIPGARTQNPVMHMFEALLTLRGASGDPLAEAGARRLGDFVANKLLQGQADGGASIPEWYDETWQPLPTKAAGGYIDLGHQFEWAHLLTTGASVSPIYPQVAERVLAYALGVGYDDNAGGCALRAFPDGSKTDTRKGWWQQAECLHALLVTAQATGRNDLWRRYEQTQALIKEQLVDAEHGGWRAADALPCKSGGCKDEQPDPYHMVRLHQAALKLASWTRPSASAALAAHAGITPQRAGQRDQQQATGDADGGQHQIERQPRRQQPAIELAGQEAGRGLGQHPGAHQRGRPAERRVARHDGQRDRDDEQLRHGLHANDGHHHPGRHRRATVGHALQALQQHEAGRQHQHADALDAELRASPAATAAVPTAAPAG